MFRFNVLLDIRDINAGLIAEVAHPVVRFLDRIIVSCTVISKELIQLLVCKRGSHCS